MAGKEKEMTTKACKKSGKKHTQIVSGAQRGAMGSAYGAKKKGKGKPRKTPSAIWKMPMEELGRHLREVGSKTLPKKVRRRKKR